MASEATGGVDGPITLAAHCGSRAPEARKTGGATVLVP